MFYLNKLNKTLGAKIFDVVLKDALNGKLRPDALGGAARVFAFAILATPYVVGGIGALLILLHFSHPAALLAGAALIAIGIYLHPRSLRNTEHTLHQNDAPELFALLDRISEKLRCPQIDGVHVMGDTNAYMSEYASGEKVIGIGGPLWLSLTPSEKLALLSHEIGHLANGDLTRGRIFGTAMHTLHRWGSIFMPPNLRFAGVEGRIFFDDRYWFERVFSDLIGTVLGGLLFLYERLLFSHSQRAEYLADLRAASLAGRAANLSVLDKIVLAPLAEQALTKMYYDGSKHIPVFELMADSLKSPNPEEARKLREVSDKDLHTIDATHPPTRYRMEFLQNAGPERPELDWQEFNWTEIDTELRDAFLKEERTLLASLLVQ